MQEISNEKQYILKWNNQEDRRYIISSFGIHEWKQMKTSSKDTQNFGILGIKHKEKK